MAESADDRRIETGRIRGFANADLALTHPANRQMTMEDSKRNNLELDEKASGLCEYV